MSLASTLSKFLALPLAPSDDRNTLRDAWNFLAPLPGGKVLYSRMLGKMVPYTGSIGAHVRALRLGHSEVEMADKPPLRNHLGSVHALALANLAELAGNLALVYSMPDGARFIVAAINIEYLKKARGTIVAISDCPIPPSAERAEYLVPVTLRDGSGAEVARATLRSVIGPTKPSENDRVN